METKLRRNIILSFVITFFLIVAIIVVWKFKFYDDVTAQLTKTNNDYSTQANTAKDLSKNLLAEAIAKDRAKLAEDELQYFRKRFRALNFNIEPSGVDGNGNRNATWRGYMNEYFAYYGLAMRRELVSAADDSSVILNTALKVDPPPQMPEEVLVPPSGFLKPVSGGTITVDIVGALPDITRFFERINRSSILMTVGAIKIEGPSPITKATFTITPFLLAKGRSAKITTGGVAATTDPSSGLIPDGSGSGTGGSPNSSSFNSSSPNAAPTGSGR